MNKKIVIVVLLVLTLLNSSCSKLPDNSSVTSTVQETDTFYTDLTEFI